MNAAIRDYWQSFSRFAATFGGFQLFFFRLLPYLPKAFGRPRLITEQLYSVGALSLVLTMFGGLFIGMVLALQSYNTLAEVGSTDSMGAFASAALVRELGPVMAALLFAGRAGSSVASELGLIIYDEPFVGLDPISMGVIVRLIRQTNDALDITSIVVTHDVEETRLLADMSYLISGRKVAAHGTPEELRNDKSDLVRQFMQGRADGPVPFHLPGPGYAEQLRAMARI